MSGIMKLVLAGLTERPESRLLEMLSGKYRTDTGRARGEDPGKPENPSWDVSGNIKKSSKITITKNMEKSWVGSPRGSWKAPEPFSGDVSTV